MPIRDWQKTILRDNSSRTTDDQATQPRKKLCRTEQQSTHSTSVLVASRLGFREPAINAWACWSVISLLVNSTLARPNGEGCLPRHLSWHTCCKHPHVQTDRTGMGLKHLDSQGFSQDARQKDFGGRITHSSPLSAERFGEIVSDQGRSMAVGTTLFPIGVAEADREPTRRIDMGRSIMNGQQKEVEHKNGDDLDALHFITHELKNSVVGIGGLIKRLMRTEEDPERKEVLKIIYDQTKFLETMSARFLLSAQIEAGALEIYVERIEDLYDEVVSPVIAVLSRGSSSSPFRESQERTAKRESIAVKADKNFLRIAYQNLLGNALKYRHPEGQVSFDIEEHEHEYLCSVWNEGPGVSLQETGKIFDKFYRSEDNTSRNRKGTGLGLYNTRRIIEAHGGKIWCETEPGQWIRFVFTLPKGCPQ